MDATTLEKFTELLTELRDVENNLKNMHQVAEMLTRGETKTNLRIDIADMKNEMHMKSFFETVTGSVIVNEQVRFVEYNFNYTIPDTVSIRIMALLIENENKHKEYLINQIKQLKIKL